MTTSTGLHRRRALAGLITAITLLAMLPGSVSAAAFAIGINSQDGSNWSWPGMAQVFDAAGPITSADLVLHRAASDTGSFRVEIRTAPSGSPSGYQAASSGTVLASTSVSAVGISTDSSAPSTVSVNFANPAIVPAGTTKLALVVLRGTNSGLAWHASTPDGTDQYPEGEGFLCVIGACWTGYTPSGDVDFVATVYGSSALPGSTPRAAIVAPNGPVRAAAFDWRILFDKPVTGLSAGDFLKSGTADGCSLGAPASTDGGSSWKMRVANCTAGTLRLTLKANAVASTDVSPVTGPAAQVPSAASLRIDRTKPGASTPAATPWSGAPLSGSILPVKLSWAAPADGGGAGVRLYEVARSTNGGGTWVALGSGQPTHAAISQAASGSVIYRVRAVDWAGNKGTWRETPTLHPRIAQQTSTNVRFSTGWTTLNDPAFSGGSARQSDVTGAAARYTFSGRAIGVVMTTDPALGIVKVYIDGTLRRTVDMADFDAGNKVIVYARRFTSYGQHVIRVVSSSGARPNVILDAFVRL